MQQADSLTVAVVFDYDGLGRLSAITGPLGDAYTYSYDLDDRVEERTFPAGEVQWGYDADHRLTSHEIVIDAATELENTMVYDAGNRVETLGGDGDGTMAYSGMGAVVWSSNLAWAGPLTVEEFLMDPFGAQIRRVSISGEAEADSVAFRNNINQYGRITYTEEEWARDYPTSAPNGWEPGYNDYAYDVSGNRSTSYQERNVWHVPESGDAEKLVEYREETRSFYAADDKLAAFQINRDSIRYDTIWGGSYEEGNWGAYEEYWYDGLGRRILKRSRQDTPHCAIAARCYSSIERIVWDGEQILWELRQAGAGDTKNPSAGDYTGTVGYVHGADVDAPLALMRFGTQVLHQTWRGLYAFATDTDGDFTTCTPEPFAYCESVAWPGGNGSTFLINKVQETQYWLGSLIMDQRDATGLSYRRNRYYDPESGQFTQQDPIGIAGGLNLYGYANGDPINFSDPFGLKIEWVGENREQLRSRWALARTMAQEALGSDDAAVRASAQGVLDLMSHLESDDSPLVRIGYAGIFDRGRANPDANGSLRIRISTLDQIWDSPRDKDEAMTLIHEAGHIQMQMFGHDPSSALTLRAGLDAENRMRDVRGCARIANHGDTSPGCSR